LKSKAGELASLPVRTSYPPSVITRVCSNWLLLCPSAVTFEREKQIPMKFNKRKIIMYSSPIIWPENVLMRALVNHRLNSEDMAYFHESRCFVLFIMRDSWQNVEEMTNSMSTVGSINFQSFLMNIFSNDITNISVHSTRLTYFNCFFQATIWMLDLETDIK